MMAQKHRSCSNCRGSNGHCNECNEFHNLYKKDWGKAFFGEKTQVVVTMED